MSLSQETLNNIGKASYQNRRIFWSNVGVDSNGIPNLSISPNFHRKISLKFPPSGDEACYIARVKCYCASSERAKYFRDSFRPRLPVLYNNRKQFEKSLPSLPPNYQNTSHSNSLVDTNDISFENDPQTEPIVPANDDNMDRNENSDLLHDEQEPEMETSYAESLPVNAESNDGDEVKVNMQNVRLDDADLLAVSNFFNDEQLNNDRKNTDESCFNPNVTTFTEEGVLKIRKVIDDECEMVCNFGEKITPFIGFDVKTNDAVSLNIPFKENVRLFELVFQKIVLFIKINFL